MIIQTSFITYDGKLSSCTHYMVGDSYENSFSFGFFIETIGKKCIPSFLENMFLSYSFIRNLAIDIFICIEWSNKHLFYLDDLTAKEIESISKLYKQFNFSHQSIFSICHSIIGTIFKAMSFI